MRAASFGLMRIDSSIGNCFGTVPKGFLNCFATVQAFAQGFTEVFIEALTQGLIQCPPPTRSTGTASTPLYPGTPKGPPMFTTFFS
jgi:hypothetical protein